MVLVLRVSRLTLQPLSDPCNATLTLWPSMRSVEGGDSPCVVAARRRFQARWSSCCLSTTIRTVPITNGMSTTSTRTLAKMSVIRSMKPSVVSLD